MSQALTLARPYARAAFSLARDRSQLPQWAQALAFSAQAAAHPDMKNVLGNPRVDATAVLDVLNAPEMGDDNYRQFLSVLSDNRRLALLPEIAGLFEQLKANEERVVKAHARSAKLLSDAEQNQLRDALKKRFNRDIELTVSVDESLIGGTIIDAGDVVIDGSIKTKLARLQASLTN